MRVVFKLDVITGSSSQFTHLATLPCKLVVANVNDVIPKYIRETNYQHTSIYTITETCPCISINCVAYVNGGPASGR
jgi:hypothetical protein